MAGSGGLQVRADGVLAEVLLEFSGPRLVVLSEDATRSDVEAVLTIAVTCWNAGIMDEVRSTNLHRQMVLQALEREGVDPALARAFLDRKQQDYSGDRRSLGARELVEEAGGFRLTVEAALTDVEQGALDDYLRDRG